MSKICDICRKAAMYTVTIGDRDGLSMVVCEECIDKAKASLEFEKWMTEVDNAVILTSSISVYDLTDQPFRDSFEDGLEPAEMAEMALEDNGWPG